MRFRLQDKCTGKVALARNQVADWYYERISTLWAGKMSVIGMFRQAARSLQAVRAGWHFC
ncbi:MAG: hypothetical protein WBW31_20450 [Candidatus Sulfotelmatobacter sp.]